MGLRKPAGNGLSRKLSSAGRLREPAGMARETTNITSEPTGVTRKTTGIAAAGSGGKGVRVTGVASGPGPVELVARDFPG
jgi:hypothetical protein